MGGIYICLAHTEQARYCSSVSSARLKCLWDFFFITFWQVLYGIKSRTVSNVHVMYLKLVVRDGRMHRYVARRNRNNICPRAPAPHHPPLLFFFPFPSIPSTRENQGEFREEMWWGLWREEGLENWKGVGFKAMATLWSTPTEHNIKISWVGVLTKTAPLWTAFTSCLPPSPVPLCCDIDAQHKSVFTLSSSSNNNSSSTKGGKGVLAFFSFFFLLFSFFVFTVFLFFFFFFLFFYRLPLWGKRNQSNQNYPSFPNFFHPCGNILIFYMQSKVFPPPPQPEKKNLLLYESSLLSFFFFVGGRVFFFF